MNHTFKHLYPYNVPTALNENPYQTSDDLIRQIVREKNNAPKEEGESPASMWHRTNLDNARRDLATHLTILEDDLPDCIIVTPFNLRNDPAPQFDSIYSEKWKHKWHAAQAAMHMLGKQVWDFWQWTPYAAKHELVVKDKLWGQEHLPALIDFEDSVDAALENPEVYLEPKRYVLNGEKELALLEEYDDLKVSTEQAKERMNDIINDLTERSYGRDALVHGRKLTRVVRKGSVSYAKAIKDLAPDADLSQYTGKPSESWKLT